MGGHGPLVISGTFLGLISPRPIQKWQENGFTGGKVTGLNLTTTFRSDRIMVFWDPVSKNKKQNSAHYSPLIEFNKCHRGTGMPNWWRVALSAVFWQSQC
jgi:hypothetical protein